MDNYIVNQKFIKGRNGGKYICRIFSIGGNTAVEVTKTFSKIFGVKLNKDGFLEFPHGCGTGIMRMQELMKTKELMKDDKIIDISL